MANPPVYSLILNLLLELEVPKEYPPYLVPLPLKASEV